jgi:peptidylprolyl isomerase/FKBP-type peptidyl-prolyl cis-trans isomerase FklB
MRLIRPALALLLASGLALAGCGRHKAAASHEEQRFLDQNAHQPGVTRLADGLEYRVVASGPADGPHPAKGDEVKVDYTGSLVSGSVFDSTSATGTPAVMKLDHLIPAWMELLPKMRPGDEWLIYAPPDMAYGAEGHPPVIPPNSVLVFDVKLLGVLKASDNSGVRFAGAAPQGPSLQAPANTAQ